MRGLVFLLVLLTAACGTDAVVSCSPCAGPHASVDLTPLVGHVPRDTTAQLCVDPPATAEQCGEAEIVEWRTPPLPTAHTAGPDTYSWGPAPGAVHGDSEVGIWGLDGLALTAMTVIIRPPGQPAIRTVVSSPESFEDSCSCGGSRGTTFRSYAYRLAAVNGPLVPRT